jgi:serine/threonine protein kinase
MVTKSGVKLLDFGLARAIAPVFPGGAHSELKTATAEAPVTHAGGIVGTLQYMAPEQLEGKAPDARSDVFALGCVLHEMTSGRRAFEGSSAAAVASSILRADAAPLRSARTLLPLGAPRHCLIKDPDERCSPRTTSSCARGLKAGDWPAPAARVASSRASGPGGPWRPWPRGLAATTLLRATGLEPRDRSASRSRPDGTRFAGWTESTTFSLPDGGTLPVAADAKGARIYLKSCPRSRRGARGTPPGPLLVA